MDLQTLVDPWSAALVLAGTALATILRCGLIETRAALHCLARLVRSGFSAARERITLARQVEDIRRQGVLRAQIQLAGDAEIGEAIAALVRHRSIAALVETHDRHRAHRTMRQDRAVHLFDQAGELAPVFGLAGTLVALSQLPAAGPAGAGLDAAIGTAVLTTLYGLVLAHFACLPLARVIARRGEQEERERQALIDWLTLQLGQAMSAPTAPSPAPVSTDLAA